MHITAAAVLALSTSFGLLPSFGSAHPVNDISTDVEIVNAPGNQDIEQREFATVYGCTGPNWTGQCKHYSFQIGLECFTPDRPLNSFGPDRTFLCAAYKNAVCRNFTGGEKADFQLPGTSNAKANPGWEINSFQCWKTSW